ncbi:MAG: hypothetical protein ACTSSE_08675 [Candidatus Thorarchaeota archaeon]
MIRITVTGDTYPIRKRLKDGHFKWAKDFKAWYRVVGEGSLNATLEALRPMRSWVDQSYPVVVCKLEAIGVDGKKMSDKSCAIKLRPEGELGGTNFLELFQKEVDVRLSPNDCSPSTPDSEKKEKKYDWDGFY